MNYLLITPVKNEEENLPKLAECITNQTILPQVWIILDDNSKDNTSTIIKKLESKFSWIKSIYLEKSTLRDLDKHFGKICNRAFTEALEYCQKKKLPIEYLTKVDADIVLPKRCMENILRLIEKEKDIGIASPYVKDLKSEFTNIDQLNETTISVQNYERYDLFEPSDGLRVYRIATFIDIDGIPETLAPDNVALAKAKLKGWKLKRFKESIVYKTRETSSSIQSINTGYRLQGLRRYYLNYPLSLVISFAAIELLKRHPSRGLAMLSGYMHGIAKKEEKILDKELQYYYRKTRPREIIENILKGGMCC